LLYQVVIDDESLFSDINTIPVFKDVFISREVRESRNDYIRELISINKDDSEDILQNNDKLKKVITEYKDAVDKGKFIEGMLSLYKITEDGFYGTYVHFNYSNKLNTEPYHALNEETLSWNQFTIINDDANKYAKIVAGDNYRKKFINKIKENIDYLSNLV